jgi:large subunit ribosomal protein L23
VATVSKDPRDIILQPVVSEKSYGLLDANTYTFVVAPSTNKIEIRQAVEEIFNVKVLNVTTMNRRGKRKRNRRTNTMGQRPTTKRAVVKVASEDRIDIFGS